MTGQNLLFKSPKTHSFNEIIFLLIKKLKNKLTKNDRFNWTDKSVFDASTIPEVIYRTYLEYRDIRAYLSFIAENTKINKCADIGCGFGRLLPLLSEYCEEVIGFEREDNLISIANNLYPHLIVKKINDLAIINDESNKYDLIVVFTVLQHLTDNKVEKLSKEITRIAKEKGYLLLCEQTDNSDLLGNLSDETNLLQHGRSIKEYEDIFENFTLIRSSKRINEPTYRRKEIGSYMLFQKNRG